MYAMPPGAAQAARTLSPPAGTTAMPIANTDPVYLPAHRLATEIAARRLSPVDVVDALLARIARHNPKLHAFIDVYEADARLAAEAADKAIRSGHAVGPLHGVPIALKDLIDLEGRITTGGSQAWRERRSPVTATLARRLVAQGMIVLGKTHTVEFAMGGWGTNQHLGTPWNPWDLATPRTPGGSSSGSGVSVASGMAPWAIGTDTGGSVRLPASWCGLAGLKTTIGRVSTYGILPLAPSLDTPGPMARCVEDAALLFGVMQGADPLDHRTLSAPPPADAAAGLKRGVRGLRLARMPAAEREGCAVEVLAAYDAALDALAGLGAEIIDIALPCRFGDIARATGRIISSEAYQLVGALVDDPNLPIDEAVRPRIQPGRTITAPQYLAALAERDALKQRFLAAFDSVDALLTPTTQTAAIRVEAVDQTTTPAHFTRLVNLLELCALAVPDGFTATGLPLSLQIVCRPYDEATALRIGWAYEQATDWHRRHPAGLDA
jgi:aspartyl-tRNA(Asn)/glutamyl-tRNA(Gln) amidotransferase subunit A